MSRKRKQSAAHKQDRPAEPDPWPMVTVQLPVYNELYVVDRLLRAVAALDYPQHRLEVQILDDSTDETTGIISGLLPVLRQRGIDVYHLRRSERSGFKAGALAYGLQSARGELIAILDADFLPAPDFLKNVVPYFADPQVGAVQARWGHLNQEYSLLTRVQAMALDTHFAVEQAGRSAGGYFLNFNGTAGLWRKSCIQSAGGWSSDTLTEDLDLSYRAQLQGWKFVYLDDVVVPAELPVSMEAARSQQFRWTKGGAACSRKYLPAVLLKSLPPGIKFHAVFHLLNSAAFVVIMILAVFSLPVLFIKQQYPEHPLWTVMGVVSLVSMVNFAVFFWTNYQKRQGTRASVLRFLPDYLLLLSMCLGLSLNNSIAALEGWLGKSSAFVRTPKFNITGGTGDWSLNRYLTGQMGWLVLLEALLGLIFAGMLVVALMLQQWSMAPFYLLLAVGYLLIFSLSVLHARRSMALRMART